MFAKLRKVTVSFVMSVCPYFCPHGISRLALDGTSWNLIFGGFLKNLSRIRGTLYEEFCKFMISCWILFRVRDVLDKSCRENQNTRFVFCTSATYEIMRKNMVQPDRPLMSVWCRKDAISMPDNWSQCLDTQP